MIYDNAAAILADPLNNGTYSVGMPHFAKMNGFWRFLPARLRGTAQFRGILVKRPHIAIPAGASSCCGI
jgi:hypothetical protein